MLEIVHTTGARRNVPICAVSADRLNVPYKNESVMGHILRYVHFWGK